MPRPSKHVSPDTLGGRIRAAREHLRLSLAEVANGHYSTSLISQIERNRVDPSRESLRFLADRLRLPLDDLEVLAHQHRESEVEPREYTSFEALRSDTARLLADKRIADALCLLEPLHFSHVPALQRWRLAALRGQCYFEQRRFVKAQGDFVYATQEKPKQEGLPLEQKQELLLLHLHLAATYRELYQLHDALEHFQIALSMMSRDTPFGLVAEAHWGMSLIALAQAMKMQPEVQDENSERNEKLYVALEHAEHARLLYRSIGETLHAASIACTIAEIELALGRTEKTRCDLLDIINTWKYVLDTPEKTQPNGARLQKEQATVVATAACLLADMELADGCYEQALEYANIALQAGNRGSILRKANAYVLLARIFEARNDVQAEQAYREAIKVLEDTERIGIRISTHVRFGSYLLTRNKKEEGQQELEQARILSDTMLTGNDKTSLLDAVV